MFRYLLCCKSNFEGHQVESKKRIRRRVKEERRGDDERDSDEAVEKREGRTSGVTRTELFIYLIIIILALYFFLRER